jgi:capsular exopolysaccharide synthesis family protein
VSSPELKNKPTVNPGLIGRYLSFLNVAPMRGTRLVKIVFTTPDPYLSQQLANAHATAFVRMNLETRFEVTKEARIYLEKKLEELKAKVEESEGELDSFRKSHDLVSMDRGENLIVDRMAAVNGSLTAARIKRIDLESVRQMIHSKNLTDLSEVMSNGVIQQYRASIESLTAEQIKLATVFKPDHPKMIELTTRINETRQRMKAAIDETVRRIETDYASALNREAQLEAEASRQRQAAIDLKGLGVKYSVLQGDAEGNKRLYNSVLSRLNETTIANDLPVSNMQVTELADSPGGLSSGGQQLKLLMTTASGALFLGVALAFCLSYFDSTFSTPNDVSRFLYLPALGVVPELRSLRYRPQGYFQLPKHPITSLVTYFRTRYGDTLSKDLILSSEPTSILSESYRSIRTALLFSQAESPPQTVLFTSPGPGEGKTVTVLNLAIALAQSGKSVLVIDADMRRGRCHRVLHRSNDRGLSNVLSGNLTLDESVQDTAVPGLFVLTRGMVPPNPPDLLGSSKMRDVLDLLRNRFEFILVDAPPVIGVTDAGVLSSICHGVVLVVHSKKTSRFSARQAVQTLESVRGHILGVVLNGINIRDPDYASYRYYYSSYYASVNPENENSAEAKEQLIEDPPDRTEENHAAALEDGSPKVISQQLFDQIIAKLVEVAGPLAPLIVRDHVDLLGECLEAFPKDRLPELVENLCEEIPDNKLKNSFRKSVAQYF